MRLTAAGARACAGAALGRSPTITSGDPEIARDACIPAILAASMQPPDSPVRTQSPARTSRSNPDSSARKRCLVLPGTDSTYRSDGQNVACEYCASNRAVPVLPAGSKSLDQSNPLLPATFG